MIFQECPLELFHLSMRVTSLFSKTKQGSWRILLNVDYCDMQMIFVEGRQWKMDSSAIESKDFQ